MTKIIICDWCGFTRDVDVIEEHYSNYHCICCGVGDIEITEN